MDRNAIEQVRRFNRLVTRQAGALNADYLQRGRALGEARLLFEIGPEGAEVGALRERLGLDSGYASRLLRSLELQGLVGVRSDDGDRRRRFAVLTKKGLAERMAYDALSDDLARSILDPLSAGQRERLLGAMREVELLLTAAAIAIAIEPPDSATARACLDAYFEELAARFEDGFDPGLGGAAADMGMASPAGCFLVARLDGKAIACGGLKELEAGTGEIKRMWVERSARGLGVARRLLAALETEARRLGFLRLRLDTNKVLQEAQTMYRKAGYAEIGRYNDNPYAHLFFEKTLATD
jgi:DNA-binding MarR family transcriptional regulator/GNAT superfamily N-acetyltransferase